MEEHGRLLFLALLFCGFGPVFLIVLYCLLTGRTRWLVSKNPEAERDPELSGILRLLGKFYIGSLPVYFALLGLFAYFGLQ